MSKKYKVGFVCGAFDLFHPGHNILLRDCKEQCEYLIVGLQVDPSIDRQSKNKPLQSIYERFVQLENCKHVDKIVPYDTEADLLNVLKTLNLDVRFLGEEYKEKFFTGDDLELPIFYLPRQHDFSSSELRERLEYKYL